MLPGLQYISLCTAGFILLALLGRWPASTAFAIACAVVLLDCLNVGTNGLTLGGVNFYLDDLALAVLVMAALLVLVHYRRGIPRYAFPCLILLFVASADLFRGIATYGLRTAGNNSRDIFCFAIPPAAIMLVQPIIRFDSSRLIRSLTWIASALTLIAVMRWGAVLPMPAGLIDDFRDVVRAIPADYSMVIAMSFIALTYLQLTMRATVPGIVAAAAFGTVTVFLQHRSVWAATVAGLGLMFVRTSITAAPRWLTLLVFGAGVMTITILSSNSIRKEAEQLITVNAQETRSDHSTVAWRVNGYEEALNRFTSGSVEDILIGGPAGWSDHTNTTASFASTHIHSRYVSVIAYYGIIGFTALVWWIALMLKSVFKARSGPGTTSGRTGVLLQVLLLSELVYLGPYSGGILIGGILGGIFAAAEYPTGTATPLFRRRTSELADYAIARRPLVPRAVR